MSSISLRQEDFVSFFETPFRLYSGRCPFISQFKNELHGLFSKSNPMIRDGRLKLSWWTAHAADGELLGRIVAHIHEPSQRHFAEKTGFFGYFDCVDRDDVAALLHARAHDWLREAGCQRVIGNFNLVATQMMGVLEAGFDLPPYVAMNYSGPAIPGLLARLGYQRQFPMTTFEVDLSSVPESVLVSRLTENSEKYAGFRWDKARKRHLRMIFEDMRLVMNDAFDNNMYFAPLTREEFWHQARDLSFILDPEITQLVYNNEDQLVGALVTIPDVNTLLGRTDSRLSWRFPIELIRFKCARDRALILFAAVRRDYHSTGLGWSLIAECVRKLKERGYRKLGITWVGDGNAASLALVKKLGGLPYHRLALYSKEI